MSNLAFSRKESAPGAQRVFGADLMVGRLHLGTSRPSSAPRSFLQPIWDGSSLSGRTVLLHAAISVADAIELAAYARAVVDRGGKVVAECDRPLKRLFAHSHLVSSVVARGEPLPRFDCHIGLEGLRRMFGPPGHSNDCRRGALFNLPTPRNALPERRPGLRLRVGVIWPSTGMDGTQSPTCPGSAVDVLRKDPSVEIFLLRQSTPDCTVGISAASAFRELPGASGDLYTLAEAITQLDLVITADMTAALLSAAVAVPVWLLLPGEGDFHCRAEGDNAPRLSAFMTRIYSGFMDGCWGDVFHLLSADLRYFGAACSRAAESAPGQRSPPRGVELLQEPGYTGAEGPPARDSFE